MSEPNTVSGADASSLATFQPFSATHAVVTVVFIAIVGALIAARRRSIVLGRAKTLDQALGIGCLIIWGTVTTWWCLPAQFDLNRSLPIHVCDVAALIAPLVLLNPRRSLRALLYFWGLALSTQGFITPIVRVGPVEFEFWAFWLNHVVIVGVAVYDVVARGYRPTWHDYTFAACIGLVYITIMLAIDLLLDANYGYVGRTKPLTPTVIDWLGPWPLRIVPIVLIALALMALFALPWSIARLLKRDQRPCAPPAG